MTKWYLEPVGQNANEAIARWLEDGVNEAERHGVPTSDGKRNLYEVTYEKVLQALTSASFIFRVYRAAREGNVPRPVNVQTLLRQAARKGYFLPVMREEYAAVTQTE